MTKFQTNPTTQNKLNTMQIIERRTQQFLLISACLREGGVTRHMLPHLSGVPHRRVNRP